MISPASSFCLCFPLQTGVKAIAWFHLCVCVYTCSSAIGNVIFESPNVGYATSTGNLVFSAVWSLVGIPLVLLGLWGVYHRQEPNVRIYFYYLVASLAIDTWQMVDLFLMRDACVRLELASQLHEGRAFACGVARGISMTAFVILTAAVAYLTYVVWSYCEDLASGGIADVIGELLASVDGVSGTKGPSGYSNNQGDEAYDADYRAIERSFARSAPPSTRLGKFGACMA
mmetsp:Transcript_57696/g.160801  ORF Transcript_57696/g.160801 Transcript_57696/m.160801 type:complete len:229 (-) Transcript_57696:29-715(-)